MTFRTAAAAIASLVVIACTAEAGSQDTSPLGRGDASPALDLGGAGPDGGDAATPRSAAGDAGTTDAAPAPPPRDDRFAMRVVSFEPGPCSGFGAADMPRVVLGPPQGGGSTKGSLDVVSLGKGGTIVLSFEPNAIVDGPGVNLAVFENAFYPSTDTTRPYAELGEVSVSDDGVTWFTFPCSAPAAPPYGDCAGWRPVHASTAIDALDPARSGGDLYDLASVGLSRARFVRIVDRTAQRCTGQGPNTNGFDLDAVAAIHAADP